MFRGLLGKAAKPALPPPVTDDYVYPVHAQDGIKGNRYVLYFAMRFGGVLDAEKLHSALSRLLALEGWRKLGGRLRLKDDGKLEVYVPRRFTAERPAVSLSHVTHDMLIAEHPLACRYPKPTDGPSTQLLPDEFQSLFISPGPPVTFEDLTRQDIPQLALHVTVFKDETFVGLRWPHTLMDGMGQQALLHSWSLVLAGREDDVPPMFGAQEDVIAQTETPGEGEEPEELELESKRLEGFSLVKFMSRWAWDKIWNPVEELRMIFLPKSVFSRLQADTEREAAESALSQNQAPFVSEADILTAWIARLIALSEPEPRPVTVVGMLNLRFRFPTILTAGAVYVQNMVVMTFAFLSAQLARGSVGAIALSHRHHLTQQTTAPQALAFLRVFRRDILTGKVPRLLFGEPDSLYIFFNNLTKINLSISKDIDFSGAAKGPPPSSGDEPQNNAKPKFLGTAVGPVYNRTLDLAMKKGLNVFTILGKDDNQNYWLMGSLQPRAWAKIEEELSGL